MARQQSNHLKFAVYQSQARKSALTIFREQLAGIEENALDPLSIKFDVIDSNALEAFYRWEGEVSHFPWEDITEWKVKDFKGFDLSIWYDQQLCGLCYATPRDSKITIKIVLLEGNPDKTHPLKGYIAALALSAVDAYARTIKCVSIEIQDPEPKVVPWYEKLGFVLDEANRLVISVQPA
ncbi:N-acetyltransferase [Pseudomonas reactans]|uniref:N-acetyltransferase n=1 Tax=Pseudomonas reactans TaxID=117680 RepID=A0ABX2QZ01_9PSED|nr:N-acetyltransferase [Pseudomonas reactans]NWA38790.1 N-acetyltransferase [Pseudomonas reactans]NWC89766.1 N-acetyltransferase [Pseudomonas reactans]NWD32147.1 N-acetyltransferase [Pseudomonas reactans]NWD95643.1 N-acetyltransferase [Pseudomonas reactans]NWF14888.1 N-acetyltransferase [Pseudomonas reactans]